MKKLLVGLLLLQSTIVSADPSADLLDSFDYILAHRGENSIAPENTIPAFQLALESGVHGTELDIGTTRDGKIVVFHDKGLKRLTGVDKLITDLTLAEVKSYDVGIHKGEHWAGTLVPTLGEVLTLFDEDNIVHVEIKAFDFQYIDELKRVIGASDLTPEQLYFTSSSLDDLIKLKKAFPQINSFKNGLTFDFDKLEKAGIGGIATYYDKAICDEAKRRGLLVRVGRVQTMEAAYAMAVAEVDIIDTDTPISLMRSLNHR